LEQLGVTVVTASGNNYALFEALGASTPAVHSTISVANTWPRASHRLRYSGNSDEFLAVEREGAVDRLAASSQRSTLPNQVAAPGMDIFSTWNGDQGRLYNTIGGTSMAAPLVSGVVALMQDAAFTFGGRYLRPDEVLTILKQTADPVTDADVPTNGRLPLTRDANRRVVPAGPEEELSETGLTFPRVNAYRAVQAVRQMVGVPFDDPDDPNATMDTNSVTGRAVDLASLNGTREFKFDGAVGRDGRVQLGAQDVDLFRVTLVSPGSLEASLAAVNGGAPLDSYLRVFDSAGQEIAANDDAAADNRYSSVGSPRLQPGTYYLGVSGAGNVGYDITTGADAANGRSEGDYQLAVRLNNPDPNGVLEGARSFRGLPSTFPGDLNSDPPPIGSATRLQVGPGDVDLFQVIAPDDGTLTVEVSQRTEGDAGPLADSLIRAFDAAGAELGRRGDDGQAVNTFLLPVTAGQVVYVGVSDAANPDYDPRAPFGRSANGTGGRYTVKLDFGNGDQNGTLFDAIDAAIGTARRSNVGSDPLPSPPAAEGERVTVGRGGAKDVDFFRYRPTADGLLDVTAVGEEGFIPSLSLWVLDAANRTVVKVGETTSASTQLIYPVTAGSFYYVGVTGLGNTDYEWYAPGSGSGGQTGVTTVTANLRPTADLAGLSDGQIQGHAAAILDLALGAPVASAVGVDGGLLVGAADVDLYRYVAPADQTLRVRTDTSAEGSSDTFLRFFDADGNELVTNGDAGAASTSSAVLVNVKAGRTFYIGVNGASADANRYDALTGQGAAPGSQGPYLLTVEEVPSNNPGTGVPFSATLDSPATVFRQTFTAVRNETVSVRITPDPGVDVQLRLELTTPADGTPGGASRTIDEKPAGQEESFEFRADPAGEYTLLVQTSQNNPNAVGDFVGSYQRRGVAQFSADGITVRETDGSATVTVERLGGVDSVLSVRYGNTGGSATAADSAAVSGTLVFQDGERFKTFTVPLFPDNVADGTKTFTFELGRGSVETQLGPRSTATLFIHDVPPPPPPASRQGNLQQLRQRHAAERAALVAQQQRRIRRLRRNGAPGETIRRVRRRQQTQLSGLLQRQQREVDSLR
jgi:hypothetical protein